MILRGALLLAILAGATASAVPPTLPTPAPEAVAALPTTIYVSTTVSAPPPEPSTPLPAPPEPGPPMEPTTLPAPLVPPAVSDWQAVFDRTAAELAGTFYAEDKGAWGATQLDTGEVWIAPRTPLSVLRSVMIHESAHVVQGRTFGGYFRAIETMAPYGGIEVTADCWALAHGATWTNYGCTSAGRRGAALF